MRNPIVTPLSFAVLYYNKNYSLSYQYVSSIITTYVLSKCFALALLWSLVFLIFLTKSYLIEVHPGVSFRSRDFLYYSFSRTFSFFLFSFVYVHLNDFLSFNLTLKSLLSFLYKKTDSLWNFSIELCYCICFNFPNDFPNSDRVNIIIPFRSTVLIFLPVMFYQIVCLPIL